MDYREEFKKTVVEKGMYDEDLKMTIFVLKEEINSPWEDKTYLTMIIEENDTLSAGVDRNGFLFIEPLSDWEIEMLVKKTEEVRKPSFSFLPNVTALMIALLLFTFSIK